MSTRTVLIPQGKKPTVSNLRPIAMSDVTYKVMMAIMREKLEEHITREI